MDPYTMSRHQGTISKSSSVNNFLPPMMLLDTNPNISNALVMFFVVLSIPLFLAFGIVDKAEHFL